jgi:hypothetical protein
MVILITCLMCAHNVSRYQLIVSQSNQNLSPTTLKLPLTWITHRQLTISHFVTHYWKKFANVYLTVLHSQLNKETLGPHFLLPLL